jgi:HlyD family secretion protein
MKKPLLILVPVALLGAGLASYLFWKAQQPFYYAGTVEAQEVDIASGLAAPILSLKAEEGQSVKKGELLAELDCREVLPADKLAQVEFQRAQSLFRGGSFTGSQLDQAQSAADMAAARASWCSIYSPITGTVLTRFQQEGEWARPGGRIMSMADLSQLYAWVYVDEEALARVRPGQAFTAIAEDAAGRTLAARVAYIRPEAEFTPKNVQTKEERQRLVHGVKLDLGDGAGLLVPGMSIESRLGD